MLRESDKKVQTCRARQALASIQYRNGFLRFLSGTCCEDVYIFDSCYTPRGNVLCLSSRADPRRTNPPWQSAWSGPNLSPSKSKTERILRLSLSVWTGRWIRWVFRLPHLQNSTPQHAMTWKILCSQRRNTHQYLPVTSPQFMGYFFYYGKTHFQVPWELARQIRKMPM